METLAYTHSQTAYDREMGVEYDLPELTLSWNSVPSSAWLGMIGVAVFFGTLSAAAPASAATYVDTPSGACLNARYGPGTNYGVYTCVSDGALLKPVVGRSGPWVQLSSGRWVYGPYTSAGAAPTPGTPGVGGTLLTIGDRGQAVRDVQLALGIPVDGIYGPQTAAAVRAFQARNGLLIDGVVGPQTRRVLF